MADIPGKRMVVSQLIALGCAALAIALMLGHVEAFERIENLASDLRFKLRGATRGRDDIVFCDIDDSTLEDLGVFPIPRNYYTRAFRVLSKAKLVLMDIFFFEPSPARVEPAAAEQLVAALVDAQEGRVPLDSVRATLERMLATPDRAMAEAAAEAGNVFLPIILQEEEAFEGSDAMVQARVARTVLADRIHSLLL